LVPLGPKDELEGMMAAQLIAAHNAAMECYRRAMIGEQTFEGRRENLNQANKLSRTWATLLDALNKHRGKGQQKVTVEHVHVHAGGQAMVGTIETPGGGDRNKSEEQPHAKQIAHAPEPAPVARDVERALIIGTFYYRTLSWVKLRDSLISTAKVTAPALFIVAVALVFSRILTFFRIPEEVLNLLLSVSSNKVVIALIIICFFLVMGTFMDAVANMIILGPLLMPVATSSLGLGMDPIQYGLFLAVGLLLGLITPPLGLLLFICGPIARVSLERTALAVLPFLAAELVVLLLITFVKPVTMAIPNALGLG